MIPKIYGETRVFLNWKCILGGGFNNTILGGIFKYLVKLGILFNILWMIVLWIKFIEWTPHDPSPAIPCTLFQQFFRTGVLLNNTQIIFCREIFWILCQWKVWKSWSYHPNPNKLVLGYINHFFLLGLAFMPLVILVW